MSEIMVKCRCCGAELFFAEDETTRRCGFCRTVNARPESRGEGLNILNRATEQRRAKDFYHAEESYRRVLELQKDEHEALWGLVLCKYGVEHVTDPRTGAQMPVCHMVRGRPMQEDPDFLRACELAPAEVRAGYEAEAVYIDAAQKRIRELQANEPGYDIFLCYKETAIGANVPTVESTDARRLYNDLSRKGYRVFYAPESLTGIAGENYEAGIYHAIRTARVMLVIGRRPEHLISPWVRSEWSRYLELIDGGEDKHLVPIYGDMSASGLPQAFLLRGLQALCMDKLTWQDELETALVRWLGGSSGASGAVAPETVAPVVAAPAAADTVLQRRLDSAAAHVGWGEYDKARNDYQSVADRYPEDYRGWWGLILCSTENLQKVAADQSRLDAWFRRALSLSDGPDRNELTARYTRYLRLVAQDAVAADIRTLEQDCAPYKQERERAEAKLTRLQKKLADTEREQKQVIAQNQKAPEEKQGEIDRLKTKRKRAILQLPIGCATFFFAISISGAFVDYKVWDIVLIVGSLAAVPWVVLSLIRVKRIGKQMAGIQSFFATQPTRVANARDAIDAAYRDFDTKRKPLDSAIQQATAKEAEYTAQIEALQANRAELINRYYRQHCEAAGVEAAD